MAETAFQTQFRQETIAAFEVQQSLLRLTTTTEAVIKGNQAEFLVAGSGGASAVTRGVNGLIPSRADDLTATTCTLNEWHDLPTKTGFNVFASQGDQRHIMQRTAAAVINRKIDEIIITELNTGTVNTGTATTASLNMALHALTILGNNDVPIDGNVYAVITPAFLAYLMAVKEFGSADYVNMKPLPGNDAAWDDRPKMWDWLGIKWMVNHQLPGKGTSAEKCFMYHRSAIGHAMDTSGIKTAAGYHEEQDYSYCRVTGYMGCKVLQNSGIVVMNHDGSALVAA